MTWKWRQNFRANLRLWPTLTPNIKDVAELDGKVYDESSFLVHLSGGTREKRPGDNRSVRQTIEAMSLAGLAYREEPTDKFLLTSLGKRVFSHLNGPDPASERMKLASMMAYALVEVAEYRAILLLMLGTECRLTNDELNRAMPLIRSLDDVQNAAGRVLDARKAKWVEAIGDEEYPGVDPRKAMNPWFLLAGGGGLLISVEKRERYRRIDPSIVPIVKSALISGGDRPLQVSTFHQPSKGTGFVGRLSDAGIRATVPSPALPLKTRSEFGDIPNDPDELQNYARRVRRGQPKFRNCLLDLYAHRCAICGHGPDGVLQAAHILPHSVTGHNQPENGVLLRADLHELFDEGLLFIEPITLVVHLHESLRSTPYWQFNGRELRARTDGSTPNNECLQTQWAKKSS